MLGRKALVEAAAAALAARASTGPMASGSGLSRPAGRGLASGGSDGGRPGTPLAPLSALLTRPATAYTTHFPLAPVESCVLAALSSWTALRKPWRADMVATVGETTAGPVLGALVARVKGSAEGRALLLERPRVTEATLRAARGCAEGSFGAAYATFMGERSFSPDDRPPVRFVADPEAAYVIQRLREVHDFWHVLFACGTNVFGETALKAVEFAQTGLPMAGLAALGGQSRLTAEDLAILRREFLPWALRAGALAADLVGVRYEHRFDEDLEDLRARLRVVVAPTHPKNTFLLGNVH